MTKQDIDPELLKSCLKKKKKQFCLSTYCAVSVFTGPCVNCRKLENIITTLYIYEHVLFIILHHFSPLYCHKYDFGNGELFLHTF